MDGLYSTKSDVFSFGVLALEIISGRKNSFQFENTSLNLVGLVSKQIIFLTMNLTLEWSNDLKIVLTLVSDMGLVDRRKSLGHS